MIIKSAKSTVLLLAVFAAALAFSGCDRDPKPAAIQIGKESCHECKMTIIDARYGGEIVTATGKTLPFDAIDCLIKFYKLNSRAGDSVFLADFMHPGQFIPAAQAVLAVVDLQLGPMGSRLIALRSRGATEAELKGKVSAFRSWNEVLN